MRYIFGLLAVTGGLLLQPTSEVIAADDYTVDAQHSGVNFKIQHAGITWVHGRFNQFEGKLALDADPANSSVTMTIKTESVDTGVKQRDDHLRSADFFDAKQYPDIVFKSTSVRSTANGLEVTGTVTLHGKTQPLTFELVGGKTAEFPPGVHRIGYTTSFVLKRSDFDMKTMLGPIGDEVHAEVSFEAIKQ